MPRRSLPRSGASSTFIAEDRQLNSGHGHLPTVRMDGQVVNEPHLGSKREVRKGVSQGTVSSVGGVLIAQGGGLRCMAGPTHEFGDTCAGGGRPGQSRVSEVMKVKVWSAHCKAGVRPCRPEHTVGHVHNE